MGGNVVGDVGDVGDGGDGGEGGVAGAAVGKWITGKPARGRDWSKELGV